MQATTQEAARYLREVQAICEHHRNDTAPEQEGRLLDRLHRLQADRWSRYDRDCVEARARRIFGLPQR